MKFAFVTCVQLGFACIEEIYRVGGKLDLVITLKDEMARSKSGRIYVDSFCTQHGIDVLKIRSINDAEAIQVIREREIDWLFIIGWSQIAKPEVLQAAKRGVLGMHPTLLPVGRGRASIPWAILKGLPETGVTLFQLDEGVDTGLILDREILPIAPDETATSLYKRVAVAHQKLISRIWPELIHNQINPIPQDSSKASKWPARTPEDGRIRLNMTVEEVDRLVRATTHPYPGAFWQDGDKTIRIWRGVISKPAQPKPVDAWRLSLSNGFFDATEYEVE
ncbi:MAG: formyltransferase family protein [Prochloraceae cyanobacterium]|nr:formyltransferase family protein [Prochloraceae cyanobacterium]